MLRLTAVLGILFLFGWLTAANAAESMMRLSPKTIREAVHATVETQIDALQKGDFEKAYEMASAGIKQQFDVRLFAALIRHGYPVLLQANEVDYGIVRDRDGEFAQMTVSLLDHHRHTIVYSYQLVKEEAGWRINGVVLEQRPAKGDI